MPATTVTAERTSKRSLPKLKAPPTPEQKKAQTEFAARLKKLMEERGMTQSSLARELWGTIKDGRGYEVARNRDRISVYLAGLGLPEEDNAKSMAKILGCTVEDLMGAEGMTKPITRNRGTITTQMVMSEDRPGWMQVQVNVLMPMPKVAELVKMLDEIRKEEEAALALGVVPNSPFEDEEDDEEALGR